VLVLQWRGRFTADAGIRDTSFMLMQEQQSGHTQFPQPGIQLPLVARICRTLRQPHLLVN
jgi:hypothetical protein